MNNDRDQLLQDLLDGRPRTDVDLDAAARHELEAYKLIYRTLSEEPTSYLSADFAERVTRAAFAPDAFSWMFWLLTGLLVLFGIGASMVTLAIALPADSVARVLFHKLMTQGTHMAPVMNAGSVVLTFIVAVGLDRWLSRNN